MRRRCPSQIRRAKNPLRPTLVARMHSAPQRAVNGDSTGNHSAHSSLVRVQCIITIQRMGSSASLDRTELAVKPVEEVSAQLRVRNNGSVVDSVSHSKDWYGRGVDRGRASCPVAVPRCRGNRHDPLPPRSRPTRRRARHRSASGVSGEDPTGSAVEEGVLTVGRVRRPQRSEIYP
jgi:hypothetical protein